MCAAGLCNATPAAFRLPFEHARGRVALAGTAEKPAPLTYDRQSPKMEHVFFLLRRAIRLTIRYGKKRRARA
jgi:hypothetical protein